MPLKSKRCSDGSASKRSMPERGQGRTAGRQRAGRADRCAQSRDRRGARAGARRDRRGLRERDEVGRRALRPSGARCPRPSAAKYVRLLGEELRKHKTGSRHAGLARERQDPRRGPGRSAGDDRHRRLRRRPVAHALRPDDAFRAPAAPHVRAVASAGSRRNHLRVQLSGGGVGVECDACRDLRQRLGVEAVAEDAAHRDRRAAHLQPRDAGAKAAADLPDVHRCRHRARHAVRRRPARRARVVHRLDRGRPQGRRARRGAAGQESARARWQQRGHRR